MPGCTGREWSLGAHKTPSADTFPTMHFERVVHIDREEKSKEQVMCVMGWWRDMPCSARGKQAITNISAKPPHL